MKPELCYEDAVMASYIQDLIGDIEWNMKTISLRDPYFEQLSVEKFTLQTLLQEINEHGDISPTIIVEEFAGKMNDCVCENPNVDFTCSVARDAALSILDGLYFRDYN